MYWVLSDRLSQGQEDLGGSRASNKGQFLASCKPGLGSVNMRHPLA